MFTLLRLVSLRHLTLSPLRTLLTVFGVATGVAVMVAIAAVNRAVLDSFRSMVDTVSGKADLSIAQGKSRFDDEALDRVKAVPGVEHAAASMSFVMPVKGMPGDSLYVLCADFTDDGYFRELKTSKGQPKLDDVLSFLNSDDQLLLSERFATSKGLKTGDEIELITLKGAKRFHIRALLDESGPVKAFGGSFAVMDLFSAAAAFDLVHLADRIDVKLAPGKDVDAMKASLSTALGPQFEVERPERRGETVHRMLLSFQMGLNMGSALALLVGVFLVYNTISIGVVQRRREIGTLRALGSSGSAMRWLFTMEAAVLGLFGSLIGIPFGLLVGKRAVLGVGDAISSIYVQVKTTDVEASAIELAIAVCIGVLGSCFAAWVPASEASRVRPVEALRRDAAAGARDVTWRSIAMGIGLVLLALVLMRLGTPIENVPLGGYGAIFCILMGMTLLTPWVIRSSRALLVPPAQALLGISGRLAADNFARAPVRSSVPVAALSIGISMSVALGGFIGSFKSATNKWLRDSVPADLFVTSSFKIGGVRNVPMPPHLAEAMRKIDGVDDVDLIRLFQHDFQGLRIVLLSLTPAIYWPHAHSTFLEGTQTEAEAMSNEPDMVVISENLSRRRNLHRGDTLELNTPSGVQKLRIGGVIVDYTSDQGLIAMSRPTFSRFFKDELVDTFEIYAADKGKRESIRKAVTELYGSQYDLYVLTNDELRDESVVLIDQTFQVTYAMEAVAVVLALLGVINTLLAAVIDRTRELGLLRAVGATRDQVIRTIAAEAACMGIVGAATGVLAGSLLTRVLLESIGGLGTGWMIPMTFPWSTCVEMSLASLVCAVAAGLYPARRAARLDVVEALAWE